MELRSSGRVVSSSARSPAQLAVGGEKESIRAYLHLKVRSLQTDPGREFTVKSVCGYQRGCYLRQKSMQAGVI